MESQDERIEPMATNDQNETPEEPSVNSVEHDEAVGSTESETEEPVVNDNDDNSNDEDGNSNDGGDEVEDDVDDEVEQSPSAFAEFYRNNRDAIRGATVAVLGALAVGAITVGLRGFRR